MVYTNNLEFGGYILVCYHTPFVQRMLLMLLGNSNLYFDSDLKKFFCSLKIFSCLFIKSSLVLINTCLRLKGKGIYIEEGFILGGLAVLLK